MVKKVIIASNVPTATTPVNPLQLPPNQKKVLQVVALFFLFVAVIIVVGLFYLFFIYESPLAKCTRLCAGTDPAGYVKTQCQLSCWNIQYYGGEKALQDQITSYEHPVTDSPQQEVAYYRAK
jgi:hypothetical protein